MIVNVEYLKEVAVEILKDLGEDEARARAAADVLVRADMRGISTHGTYLLTLMAKRVEEKVLDIPTTLTIVNNKQTTSVIDGGNGLGQIAAREAMENSIKKAREFGIGLTQVRNTNNVGFLGYYTNLAAQRGFVGIMGGNAAASMAPWGGTEQFFGTNPISISVPTEGYHPLVLDMSSSVVARGKIRRASRNQEKIPEGWAIDQNGEPTTDPDEALKGSLLPIGGPKGSALAMMVDILAGMLSGSSYGPDVKTFHKPLGPTGVGLFCIAINIEDLCETSEFYMKIKSYIESIKKMKKVKSTFEIFMPGEIEFNNEEKSLERGVEVDRKVVKVLNNILEDMGSELSIKGG